MHLSIAISNVPCTDEQCYVYLHNEMNANNPGIGITFLSTVELCHVEGKLRQEVTRHTKSVLSSLYCMLHVRLCKYTFISIKALSQFFSVIINFYLR